MKRLRLIRGSRILEQIAQEESLDEATYQQLLNNTLRFIPPSKRRQFATDPIRVNQLEIIPYQQSKDLKCECVVKSGGSGKDYDIILLFMQVEYQDEDVPTNVSFVASDKETYHILPIQLARANIKVRCECLDFFYRFAWQNDAHQSLYGPRPPPYRKKTNRPPANRNNVPGVCKHIIKSVLALRDAGLVKG